MGRLTQLARGVILALSLLISTSIGPFLAASTSAASPRVTHLSMLAGVVADDNGHLWVTDGVNNSVLELNASTGTLVRDVSATADDFNGPSTSPSAALTCG